MYLHPSLIIVKLDMRVGCIDELDVTPIAQLFPTSGIARHPQAHRKEGVENFSFQLAE